MKHVDDRSDRQDEKSTDARTASKSRLDGQQEYDKHGIRDELCQVVLKAISRAGVSTPSAWFAEERTVSIHMPCSCMAGLYRRKTSQRVCHTCNIGTARYVPVWGVCDRDAELDEEITSTFG